MLLKDVGCNTGRRLAARRGMAAETSITATSLATEMAESPENPDASRNDDVERIAERIAEQIEGYLAHRGGAADTLDGVVHWWLLQQRVLESEAEVKRALDLLCSRGRIRKRVLPDSTEIYQVNAEAGNGPGDTGE